MPSSARCTHCAKFQLGVWPGRVGVILVSVTTLAAVLVLAGAASGATETVSLPASADTYLRSGASDTNEGGAPFLRVRASGDNRALVRFDQAALQAAVGSGMVVSASLEFRITQNSNNWGSSGRTISVYRLNSDWAEGNGFVDQGSPPNRGTGSGGTWACAVDANIANQAKDCSGSTAWEMGKPSQPQLHPWTEPATASALITNGLTGTVSFDVTADVRTYLSGDALNKGWIVKKDLEGQSGQVQLGSRETGGGPRLVLTVERTPADTDAPYVEATGMSSFDPPGEFTNGLGSVAIDVTASDGTSGVQRVSVSSGGTEFATASPSCTPSCPQSFDTTLTFGTVSLSDGSYEFVAYARDAAGNVGAGQPFALWVDRSAPNSVSDLRLARYEGDVATFAWADGVDPQLVGGTPGSGVQQYAYRYRVGTGVWSESTSTDVPEFDLVGVALGEIVDVEVKAIDAVGNVGPTTSATLTVFAAAESLPWYSDTSSNPPPAVVLTPTQIARASAAALGDSRIAALLTGLQPSVDDVIPWSTGFTTSSIVGAQVTLSWSTPVTLETDWPLADLAEDGQSYTLQTVYFRAQSVVSLTLLVEFDPDELVAFDVLDGDVDPNSIQSLLPLNGRTFALAAAAVPVDTPEGAGDDRNAHNVYRLTGKLAPWLGPDVFWNWDATQEVAPVTQVRMSEKADWPVAVIFTGPAISVDVAKVIWSGRFLQNPMRMLLTDGLPNDLGRTTTSKPLWDRDEGAYLGNACYGHKWHYRAYAPSPEAGGDNKMFNLALGYYVIATIHQDHHDPDPEQRIPCGYGPWHGGTDKAEAKLARAARNFASPLVPYRFDALAHEFNLYNKDERGRKGRRVYDSDGWATRICARTPGVTYSPCQQE